MVVESEDGLWAWRAGDWALERARSWEPEGLTDWLRAREARWATIKAGAEVRNERGDRYVYFSKSEAPWDPPTLSPDVEREFKSDASAVVDTKSTTAFRLIHGGADGWEGVFVDRLGEALLIQRSRKLSTSESKALQRLMETQGCRVVYEKRLRRGIEELSPDELCPRLVRGDSNVESMTILENGVRYEMRFDEGYSVGLFLDQRENRRRILRKWVAPGFSFPNSGTLLNLFSYTCGFSVVGALADFETTSMDLSKRYLDWGRGNLRLNDVDPETHDFIFGDVFDWAQRFRKRGRRFNVVIVDPPTFSKSKKTGVFRLERDLERLMELSMALVSPGGILYFSCNTSRLLARDFYKRATDALRRSANQFYFVTQPRDFLSNNAEPYLKGLWAQKRSGGI